MLDTTIGDGPGLQRTGEQREVSGVIGRQRVELVHVEQRQLGDVELGATDIALLDLPSPTRGDALRACWGPTC